jgi:hypothetical protein
MSETVFGPDLNNSYRVRKLCGSKSFHCYEIFSILYWTYVSRCTVRKATICKHQEYLFTIKRYARFSLKTDLKVLSSEI